VPTPIPTVRPEIPSYSLVPTIAQELGLGVLGTFHERQGDQLIKSGNGLAPSVWGRIYGDSRKQTADQTVARADYQLAPTFDGHVWGIQAGFDLYARNYDDGRQVRLGAFYAHSEASGTTRGNVLGVQDALAGSMNLKSENAGGYATYIGSDLWYLDVVGMYSWLSGHGSSYRDVGASFKGHSYLFSAEAGYPIKLAYDWTLETQGQFIVQNVSLNPTSDLYATINFDDVTTYTGRLTARIEHVATTETAFFQPFLHVDLWHNFSGKHEILFNTNALVLQSESTTLKLGTGFTTMLKPGIGFHAGVDWAKGLAQGDYDAIGGNIGLRIVW